MCGQRTCTSCQKLCVYTRTSRAECIHEPRGDRVVPFGQIRSKECTAVSIQSWATRAVHVGLQPPALHRSIHIPPSELVYAGQPIPACQRKLHRLHRANVVIYACRGLLPSTSVGTRLYRVAPLTRLGCTAPGRDMLYATALPWTQPLFNPLLCPASVVEGYGAGLPGKARREKECTNMSMWAMDGRHYTRSEECTPLLAPSRPGFTRLACVRCAFSRASCVAPSAPS